jgi:hypothetical protein
MNSNSTPIKGTIAKEELAKVIEVINAIENDPKAIDFLSPVDYIGKK